MSDQDEPLFTVGEEELPNAASEPTRSRMGWGVAILVAIVVLVGVVAIDPGGRSGSTEPTTMPDLEAPSAARSRVVDGWSWSPLRTPSADAVVWARSGLAAVARPWARDATWSFSPDGESWTKPQELAYNPIASISTTTGRSWSPVLFGVRDGSTWRLELIVGLPRGLVVGSVAEWQGKTLVASAAPWARIDWPAVAGTRAEFPPAVSVDGNEVVVSAPAGWPRIATLSAEHDPAAAEFRLLEADGTVRAVIAGVPVSASPEDPTAWVHHGVVPQRLLLGGVDSATYDEVDPPWAGEAAIAADSGGFVAVSVSPDAKGLELWRSATGRDWILADSALVSTLTIEKVRAAAGGESVVGEFCTALGCTRFVHRDGLWWAPATGDELSFPSWNGSEWWVSEGDAAWTSPDAITWDRIMVPSLHAGARLGVYVLPGQRVVVATDSPAGIELFEGRRVAPASARVTG